MTPLREELDRYAEAGVLDEQAHAAALQIAGETPDAQGWRVFLDRLLVVSGALLVAVALIFFVAFNWQELGRFAKFGLLEAMVLLPTAYALYAGLSPAKQVRSQAALLFAVLALGGLLALVGQTYQTGADNYELFLAWAALALPWVLGARWAPLWAMWWALVNLALLLYLAQVMDPLRLLFFGRMRPGAVALLNVIGLFAAEWAYTRMVSMDTRWLARLCALLALAAASFAALFLIFDGRDRDNGVGAMLYGALILGGAWYYQHQRRDLFPLACGALSLIVVSTGLLGKFFFKHSDSFGAFVLMSFFVIGATVAATWWLRELNRKWHAAVPAEGEVAA